MYMVQAGAIPALLRALESTDGKQHAADALASIAAWDGACCNLIVLLILLTIGLDASYRARIVNSNVIPTLVKMLKSGAHSQSAVGALERLAPDGVLVLSTLWYTLTLYTVDAQKQMVKADAIPALVEALNSLDSRRQAASTLVWLAFDGRQFLFLKHCF